MCSMGDRGAVIEAGGTRCGRACGVCAAQAKQREGGKPPCHRRGGSSAVLTSASCPSASTAVHRLRKLVAPGGGTAQRLCHRQPKLVCRCGGDASAGKLSERGGGGGNARAHAPVDLCSLKQHARGAVRHLGRQPAAGRQRWQQSRRARQRRPSHTRLLLLCRTMRQRHAAGTRRWHSPASCSSAPPPRKRPWLRARPCASALQRWQ